MVIFVVVPSRRSRSPRRRSTAAKAASEAAARAIGPAMIGFQSITIPADQSMLISATEAMLQHTDTFGGRRCHESSVGDPDVQIVDSPGSPPATQQQCQSPDEPTVPASPTVMETQPEPALDIDGDTQTQCEVPWF